SPSWGGTSGAKRRSGGEVRERRPASRLAPLRCRTCPPGPLRGPSLPRRGGIWRDMAIGVFDSGIGGLTIPKALVGRRPEADFTPLPDQANTPYGGRPGEEIVELPRAGCVRLFEAGCDLVILACNPAAAVALRRLQQTWLPGYRRQAGRNINALGIIV